MTIPILDYDERKDAHDSYYAAVEAKRLRGDTSWPARDHVPVEPIHAPNWWLWAILIACAFAWPVILFLIVRAG